MQPSRCFTVAMVAALSASLPTLAAGQSEESRAVADGGISVAGWMGKIDASEAGRGLMLENAKLSGSAEMLHVTTGPAVAYWNPANTASGAYTVSATFTEPKYMNVNDHPHPYGVFVGGQNMGSDTQTYLYCAAYGSGTFIVRGFGPEPFQLNGRRAEPNDAVHKAAGPGEPVTQEIAVTVTADEVQCAINGTVVGSYPTSDVVGAGKLTSTDGVYGVRFAHNTEGMVEGLALTQN